MRFSGVDDPTFGGDLAVIYTFDEDVSLNDSVTPTGGDADQAGRFFIYDEDGMPFRGVTADDSEDDSSLEDNEVRVTFSADESENDTRIQEAVVATVNDLAVTDDDDDDDDDFNIEAAAQLIQQDQ